MIPKSESISNAEAFPKFIAFGNALLDFSVVVKNDVIHRNHQLDLNEEGECSSKKIDNILSDTRKELDDLYIYTFTIR